MRQHMNSASSFIHALSLGSEDCAILYGNFLDDFYRATIEEKAQMLSDEPKKYDGVCDIDYVNIAA